MPLTIDNKTGSVRKFPSAPYFDDFDENNNYQRILFRPTLAVQTRELNQIQTILQDQIGVLADSLVGSKTAILGGKPNFNKKMDYIKLADGTTFSRPLIEYQEMRFKTDNGIEGKISFAIPAENGDPATLYVQYTTASPVNGRILPESSSNIIITFADNNTEVVTAASDEKYVGLGSSIVMDQGIYYIRKTFVRVPAQLLILKKYGIELTDPDFTVGLLIKERIVTPEMNLELLDNAAGTPNETAPGAHRYQITGLLVKKSDVPEEELENFISLMRIEKNEVASKPKEENSVLPDILAMLARRTNDESGDYVVDPFDMDVREHLLSYTSRTDGTQASNNGVYSAQEGGKEEWLCLQFDPGVAYVRGWEVRIQGITRIPCPKARDTKTIDSTIIQTTYTNSIVIKPTAGDVSVGEKLLFKDSAGSTIGSAFVIGVKPFADGTSNIRLYLVNINFNANQSFGQIKRIITSGSETSLVAFAGDYVSSDINNMASSLVYPLPNGMAQTVSPSVLQFYKTFTLMSTGSELVLSNEDTSDIFSADASDYYVYVKNDKSGTPASLVQMSQNTVKLNLSNIIKDTAQHEVKVIAKVFSSNPSIKIKTLVGADESYSETKSATTLKNNRIFLNKADGQRLLKVISALEGDITSKFDFDNGQKESYYDKSALVLKPGQGLDSNDSLTVYYAYFQHSATGDFFAVDSYKSIDYADIPTYVSPTGDTLFLGAALDFRPRINDASTSIETGAKGLVYVNEQVISKVTYYLSRRDRVMVTSAGNLVLVQGEPAFVPQLPPELSDAITLYTLLIKPYTFGINDLVSLKSNHKRYTMQDIGKLETRLTNVEEVTLLNKLERDTESINFEDAFKSGYIVDNFSTSGTGDLNNRDYTVIKDIVEPSIRPRTVSDFIDMAYEPSLSSDVRFHPSSGSITLDYTVENFITQPLCSSFIKVQPLLSYGYGTGTLTLVPSQDVWKEDYFKSENLYTSTTNKLDDVITNTNIITVKDK